ncbi:MFS transporter [Aetokthonos hydrillicola Thurmond2011]|jgi:MFS family permease|uniref:MFS transporter n=1 Tax=Aetokthonos hydrillicola Thurmond2011 TaxID=2712845 RepID=A0AAP5I747_9CYAN|nr:MFS transporter [Aetokthonos hydrillicola]MBO3457404.1 MFS transporter [Aetokthonos hydrillicola CCALA 1050]MBW4589455.1 MFS transporter [Aetokthonos hydrillicola CCALA 1050]MDR9893700.1 MFS transporter [Aetokthonos hydrillicola Thurmond2011]
MKKLGLLGSLYVAQFLPVAFFMQTLPVFLRQQGVSLEAIGLANFLSLPWTLKVLWSPIVDRYGWTRWGHYKSWILAMQSLLALTIVFCASLNIRTHALLLVVGMLLITTFAATQDIATDALAIGLLKPSERGLGNGIQNAGRYLGGIVGGGGILILLEHWGWTRSMLAMALSVLLLIIPILFHRENLTTYTPNQFSWSLLPKFFSRLKMGRWILVLLLYMMGATIANTMFHPLLVDLKLSLAQIGLMNGVVAYSAGIVGAVVGGFLIKPLGRKQSLIVFGVLMAIANAAFVLPTLGFTSLPVLYLVSSWFQFTYSMACIPMYTVMMDKSRLGTAGFDYTLQVSIVFIGSLIAGGMSGFIAKAIGYQGVFVLSVAIALASVAVIATIFDESFTEPQ